MNFDGFCHFTPNIHQYDEVQIIVEALLSLQPNHSWQTTLCLPFILPGLSHASSLSIP
jgi:hypothetical protein